MIPLRWARDLSDERQNFEKPAAKTAARSRVTVILFDDQRAAIDAKLVESNATGRRLARSQVMRALVDAFIESEIDLSSIRDEAHLRSVLSERIAPHQRLTKDAFRG